MSAALRPLVDVASPKANASGLPDRLPDRLPPGAPRPAEPRLAEARSAEPRPASPAQDDAAPALDAARRLLEAGRTDAAHRLLRRLPAGAATRAERVARSIEAAAIDAEFQLEVATADAARDAGLWPDAESAYWRALRLYPLHAGYMVQYGHVLKEQGKIAEAEIAYRSARALGAPPQDVDEHILYVQGLLGHAAPLPPIAAAAHPLDLPPTRDDVALLFALFLHRPPGSARDILDLLRDAPSCRAVALALVRRDAFRAANRDLMILLAEHATRAGRRA